MDIRWLQDFLTVAETGNFTRAASLRHVSQAAFSRRIRHLEMWLGHDLVDRRTFPARLTRYGELFRERAADIVQQLADTRVSLVGTEVGRGSQIRIALPHALATGQLPVWWASWLRRAEIRFSCSVISGNVYDTVNALLSGSVDLLICYHTQQQPIHLPSNRYSHVLLGKESLRLYASAASIAKWREAFPGKNNHPLPLLMYAKSSTFAREVEAIIDGETRKLVGRKIFESEASALLRAMVVADHGVAWLPECVANESPRGAIAQVVSSGWSADLSIVAYRDKHRGSPAMESLWTLLQSSKFSVPPVTQMANGVLEQL